MLQYHVELNNNHYASALYTTQMLTNSQCWI